MDPAIHAACEVYALNKQLPEDIRLLAFLESWFHWFDSNVERVAAIESVFVAHEHGYAGRVDSGVAITFRAWRADFARG